MLGAQGMPERPRQQPLRVDDVHGAPGRAREPKGRAVSQALGLSVAPVVQPGHTEAAEEEALQESAAS